MAQQKFIQATIDAEKAFKDLETARKTLSQLILTLEEKQKLGILVLELARYEERILYGRTQIKQLKNTCEQKQNFAKRKKLELLEKAKDHKALNTLKEQQNRTWKLHLDKKEAAMLDEIAILRHDRKNY